MFGPNNATCTGAAVFTSTVPVAGNGNYTSAPFTTPAAGVYRFVAAYSGDANNTAVTTGCNDANESVIVTKAPPAIVTHASAPVAAGGTISDVATLSGGVNPTGTIRFTVFGPNDATCSRAAIFTSTRPVSSGNGNYSSAPFTVTMAGTYRFIAAYSGDANNVAVATTCNDANESVVVSPATPAIVTNASATVPVGGPISDSATLSGGVNPTGTITFTVFGPNDATCTKAPAFTSIVAVTSGNGTYPSGPFVTTAAGTYRFVAAYSGDANNVAVTTLCNDPNESVVVGPASPALVTAASASVPVGGTVNDTATLSGGVNPTGTITFELFGPTPGCTGAAIFTTTKPVSGNGNYTSASFTVTAPGTYNFVASYSGDANNAAIPFTACGAAGENVTVTKAAPAIVTTASAPTPAGGPISDTATLSLGVAPTGTITFSIYGPNNVGCTGAAIFTSTKTVNGNGNYTSDPFTTSVAGTYRFIAAYSGDANNSAVTSGCNDANESVLVTPAAPAIVTHASATVSAGWRHRRHRYPLRRRQPDRDHHLHPVRPQRRDLRPRRRLHLGQGGQRQRRLHLRQLRCQCRRHLPLGGRLQRRREQRRRHQRLQRGERERRRHQGATGHRDRRLGVDAGGWIHNRHRHAVGRRQPDRDDHLHRVRPQ